MFIDLPMKKKDSRPDFAQLRQAAASGCAFCKSLYEAIQWDRNASAQIKPTFAWENSNLSEEVVIKFRYCYGPDLGLGSFEAGRWPIMLAGLEAVIYRKDAERDPNPMIIVFKVHCEPNSPVGEYLRIRRRPREHLVLSQNNLRTMKDWIQDCRNNHYACCPLANSAVPARPTRLVYVGDRRLGYLPRLVWSQYLPEDVRYAALSYCWGPPSNMHLITTTDTLNDRLRGISWDEIPRTFCDAFLVARMLGLDYIWIDALCIIQFDVRDWEIEAAKMGDIYRRAQITLVAASSRSTNDGFLRRMPPRESVRVPYQSSIHKPIGGQYYLTFSERGYTEEFGKDVEESMWNGRGWTFQERQLSRRVLFFGERQFYFECRMHRQLEDYESPLHRSLALYKHMQNTDDWDVLHMSWRRIVEEFSAREFTYDKDRLPALSGLAREIISKAAPGTGQRHEYLAGLWRSSLEIDLMWISEAGQEEGAEYWDEVPRFTSLRSPTWSWFSLPSRVVWPRQEAGAVLQPRCVVERAFTQLKSQDPLGDVASGYIDIVGPMAEIEVPGNMSWNRRVWSEINVGSLDDKNVSRREGTGFSTVWHQVDEGSIGKGTWGRFGALYYVQCTFDEKTPRGELVWLASTCDILNTTDQFHYGLILKAITGHENGMHTQTWPDPLDSGVQQFQRIGVFRVLKRKKDIVLETNNGEFKLSPDEAFETVIGFQRRRYRII